MHVQGATKDEGGEEEVGNTALHFSTSINHMVGLAVACLGSLTAASAVPGAGWADVGH